MRSLVVAAVLVPLSALADPVGRSPTSEVVVVDDAATATPIIGGTPATVGQYPTVVAVEVGGGLCSGTVITKDWVLTAAHCVSPSEVGVATQAEVTASVRVHLGTVDINTGGGMTLMASDTFPDPMFSINSLGQYDSGLIKLATPVTSVTPVRVNFTAAQAAVGVMVTMVGFGTTATGGGAGSVGVEYVVNQQSVACTANQGSDANLLCFNQTTGKGKCNGDSGGPSFAMVGGQLLQVGITSFGDNGCTMFGADTRTDAEKPFLLMHVPELECQTDADCPMMHECFMHACIVTPFAPSGLGATCTANGDCQSGQCGSCDGGMKCTTGCTVGTAGVCPAGFDCLGTTGTQGACWPHSAHGGCCDAGGASGSSIALGLGVGALVLRRRRRR
jgi:hypothetical protein